jgi:FAD/FMN-containing dehydrogenase
MNNSLLAALRNIVGAAHVLNEGDLSAFERDWRGRVNGKALAVVRPKSTLEVSQVMKLCHAEGIPIVAQGGNTGLVGGSIPDSTGRQVVLQLGRMSAIRSLDKHNLTVTVEAGCVLQLLQQKMQQEDLLFPLSLAAEGSCMIGGNLATNAGGTQVLRYGNARDLCLGLEVVTADGSVMNTLGGLRKDNTGYDLRDLFIGSEGTLGIITAATLKLYPMPKAVVSAWACASSIDQVVNLLGLAQQKMGAALTGFELMGRHGLELVAKHHPQFRVPFLDEAAEFGVLIECSDNESDSHAHAVLEGLLESAMESDLINNAVVAESLEQSQRLWDVREHLPMAQAKEGPNIKHDISLSVSRIPAFLAEAEQQLDALVPGIRPINFGHLGDGNLHYNVAGPLGSDPEEFVGQYEKAVEDCICRLVAAHGGSFSAEHGIGAFKVDKLEQYKDATALRLMKSIKQALDPMNLLNPGRVLHGSEVARLETKS